VLLFEFSDKPLREAFYKANDLSGCHIADPFMGGGTPILEANRIGCNVTAFDINPMSYWIVKQEIEHLDLGTYSKAADALELARNLDIEFTSMPIEETINAYGTILAAKFKRLSPDVTEENLQAGIRGNILMALSNKFGWPALTTGNIFPYCTLPIKLDLCGWLLAINH